MKRGGYYPESLAEAASIYPVLTHGLTMSLGGTDPLDDAYLHGLRDFVSEMKSPWHSDHLCFGSARGVVLHDLLPIAFTEAAVVRVADRIARAKDALGVPMAVENISYYLHPGKKEMGEAEFIARVCERADCGLMLDVNNPYVNATNFGFDVDEWMRTVPLGRVVQIHVAGHEWFDEGAGGTLIVNTHGADVSDPVLALLGRVLPRIGPVPVSSSAIRRSRRSRASSRRWRGSARFTTERSCRGQARAPRRIPRSPRSARKRETSSTPGDAPTSVAASRTASRSGAPPRSRRVIAAAKGLSARTCTTFSPSRYTSSDVGLGEGSLRSSMSSGSS